MNNAVCHLKMATEFVCDCPPGFHGKSCEYMIDACYGNPCKNGAVCKLLEEGRFRFDSLKIFYSKNYLQFSLFGFMSVFPTIVVVVSALLDFPATDAK